MLKPSRGLNKPSAEKKNRGKGRRAVVLVLLAACSAAVLTACGTGLNTVLKNSLLGGESMPSSRVSAPAASEISGDAASSGGASSAPLSASSVAPRQPESEHASSEYVDDKEAKKPLRIAVSLDDQTVSVFDAEDRIVHLFSCSTGKSGSDTPSGTFTISDRGKSFYNPDVQEGAYYWTRFKGAFLFHSLPFDSKEDMIPSEAEKLGTKASHGCVRLTLENAKWIYDNIPEGTKVIIA